MESIETIIARAAQAMQLADADLRAIFGRGVQKTYEAGAWLFHESTPRGWAGIVQAGELEIVRGLHGSSTVLARLGPGAMIAEGALLDNTPHTTGAFTREGVVVWQIPRAIWEEARQTNPAVFYRVVARVAEGINIRLHYASEQLAGTAGAEQLIGSVRREHDLLGERELPSSAYYGVQTLRALENFPLSGIPLKNFAHFVDALAFVKKASAQANGQLGVLDQDRMQAICAACDEVLAGQWRDQFVVDMFQGGAGTSTNMNANEVIANRALELMGHQKGEYDYLHPNDHVNCSQSTNDAYPTAIKLAVILSLKDTMAALNELKTALETKAAEFADVLKMGRTENQDAVPMTLGQEFGAYAVMIGSAMRNLNHAVAELHDINMGGDGHRHRVEQPARICGPGDPKIGSGERSAGV